MSATRILASYLSNLQYEDLPASVVEKAKVAITDALGNSIGGYPIGRAGTFLELARNLGGGRPDAMLIGDGTKVSVPMAAFGNGALSTMLDYSDSLANDSGRNLGWLGALAVPAALAAGESRSISGKELIASVVAGYEAGARIVRSMDRTEETAERVTGATTSVFAAAGAAARALGLDEEKFLSALGMTGIYTPVPAGYKWLGDEGLTPRKDIKQGWAWMCMTGAFAAVSAGSGLEMLQENNILDGDRGLWVTLGMDTYDESEITGGLGHTYHILKFGAKDWPGCATTHTTMIAATGLLREHDLSPDDIERIDVALSETDAVGFDDQEPNGLSDMEFSIPYQVSAALLAGDKGPQWYSRQGSKAAQIAAMAKRATLSFDEECERAFRESHIRLSKVAVLTKSGQRYSSRADDAGRAQSTDEVRSKFVTTTSQVIDQARVDRILSTIEDLENLGKVSELMEPLHW